MKKDSDELALEAPKRRRARFIKKLKLIAAIIKWLIVWPIFIGAIAFIVLMIFGGVFGSMAADKTPGYIFRGGMLLYTLVMAMVCLFFIRRQKAADNQSARVGAHVLRGYMLLGVLLGAGIACAIPDTTADSTDAGIQTNTTASVSAPALEHDPNLVAILGQVGASDIDGIDQRYVDSYSDPAFPEKAGEYQAYINTATGQFVYGTLTVKRGLDPEQEKVTVAHEYLHHVWHKLLDDQTKENLTAHLIGMYGNDVAIRARVLSYVDAGKLYPTELFSYYCTESSDGYLTEYVRDTCNRYINRSSLQLAR